MEQAILKHENETPDGPGGDRSGLSDGVLEAAPETAGPRGVLRARACARLGQSNFTYMNELEITIAGQSFPHMLYHFVLTCSNREDSTL